MSQSHRCNKCGELVHVGDWFNCPHESIVLKRLSQPPPIVVYRNVKGDIKFPGRSNQPIPKRLRDLGYQRVEIPFNQVHHLESEMNSVEKRRYEEYKRKESESFGSIRQQMNSELRQLAQNFSPEGQDMVRECMKRYSEKSSCPSYDPGFHLDILHNDSSSRDPWCDKDTGWKNRRE